VLYTVVLFCLFLIAQFPHDVVVRRALASIDLNPYQLDYTTTRFAWWRGLELRGLQLSRAGDDQGTPPLFESSSIFIRPGFSGLLRGELGSVFVSALLYGGNVDGSWATSNGMQRATLELHGLDIGRYRFLTMALGEGQIAGQLSGAVSAEMRRGNVREGQIAGEIELANGQMAGVTINGLVVPEVNFDTIAAKFAVNGGHIDIEEFHADGRELRASGSGQITLRTPLNDSVLNLKATVQPGPEPSDSVKGLLMLIPRPKNAKPDAPMTITGTLAQPRVR
jgi:type II secretion system protein N